MAKVTPKENFMKLVGGGCPDYVPFYTMMGEPYLGEAADAMMMAPFFDDTSFTPGGTDMWGVKYVAASSNTGPTMPDTRTIMLEEISDWSKVIKFPKMNDIDLERCYQEGLKTFDRSRTALKMGPGLMPFQELVAMMGFTNGLIALYEDPEEVSAMLNAMIDHIEPTFEKILDVYKPDLWYMLDDTCAKEAPFFSVETYRKVFKPIYERLAKPANDRGIPIVFHNCGKCEDFIDDMVDFGVSILEPMQESNDILAVKEKYKGKLSVVGGWDWGVRIPKNYPEYDEEELRQGIRDVIDLYSPGGGYGFIGWPISYPGDPVIEKVWHIVRDEVHWYGRKVYGYKED